MEPSSGHTRRFSFIGVTTGKSAIMRVFPAWAEHLGLADVEIIGHDFLMHAPPESYREVVGVIASDPLELGGLVTTHKIDLLAACGEMFDFIDPCAELCGEVSSLSKRGGLFRAHAKDPISSGRSLDEFVEEGYWALSGAEVILFGGRRFQPRHQPAPHDRAPERRPASAHRRG
jgi:shikimate 5-dehydrogenase